MRGLIGVRIRERRLRLGLTQTELARRAGISPSYLNLIESNKRPVSGRLLGDLAEALDVALETLDGSAERRLLSRLTELANDPEIGAPDLDPATANEFIARHPAWARCAARAMERYASASDDIQAMADRLSHDPVLADAVHAMLTEITALRSTAEILTTTDDLSAEQRKRFEEIVGEQSIRLSDTGAALARYFDDTLEARRLRAPDLDAEDLLAARPQLAGEIEALADRLRAETGLDAVGLAGAVERARTAAAWGAEPPAPRSDLAAALAERAVAEGLGDALDQLLGSLGRDAPAETLSRARKELSRRTADALRAPAETLGRIGSAVDWRLSALAGALDGDGGLAARRLGALSDWAPAGAPRATHLECDRSGGVLARRGVLDWAPRARALTCPQWPLFDRGLHIEGRAEARVTTTEGYTLRIEAAPRGDGRRIDLILREDESAEGPRRPIGPSCRLCGHAECAMRRRPPLIGEARREGGG